MNIKLFISKIYLKPCYLAILKKKRLLKFVFLTTFWHSLYVWDFKKHMTPYLQSNNRISCKSPEYMQQSSIIIKLRYKSQRTYHQSRLFLIMGLTFQIIVQILLSFKDQSENEVSYPDKAEKQLDDPVYFVVCSGTLLMREKNGCG